MQLFDVNLFIESLFEIKKGPIKKLLFRIISEPDGGSAVGVLLAGHVLGEGRGHNDDVIRDGAQSCTKKLLKLPQIE